MLQSKERITDDESSNVEFYLENGKVVFTAYFLLKRGFCCESGCRHCPYIHPVQDSIKK